VQGHLFVLCSGHTPFRSQDKKKHGSLELQRRRAKLQAGNSPVVPYRSPGAFLCFGDVVFLEHVNGLIVGCDIWDELLPGQGVFSVSSFPSGKNAPTARCAFILEPPSGAVPEDSSDPTPVAYGESFRLRSLLRADEEAVERGLLEAKPICYLASTHKSERMASRLTNRQMVYMVAGTPPETLWTFERAVYNRGQSSAEDKYFSNGQPVEVSPINFIVYFAVYLGSVDTNAGWFPSCYPP
jgi:hypothetical protein